MICPLCNGTKRICMAVVGSRAIMEQECPECAPDLNEEEYDPEEDERFEAADMAYDLSVEDF